jgi:hypothetical protein
VLRSQAKAIANNPDEVLRSQTKAIIANNPDEVLRSQAK